MERTLNLRTKSNRLPLSALATLALCAVPTLITQHAEAHIRMDQPIARNVWAAQPFSDPIKQGPCGSGENDPRSTDPAKINTFAPGETITVSWEETIDHPGFFRIAIDMDGQDAFVDPSGPTDIQDPPVLPVLMDGIADEPDGTYSVEVTLPNETCDNCTLQLIQFMTNDNESYYVCADLVIEGPVSGDGDGDGTGGGPDGTTTEPTEGAGGALVGSGGSISSGGSDASGGTTSGPSGSGGQGSGVGGSVATGGADPTTQEPTGDDTVETGGCTMVRGAPSPTSAIAWMLGLAGLFGVIGARRRVRR